MNCSGNNCWPVAYRSQAEANLPDGEISEPASTSRWRLVVAGMALGTIVFWLCVAAA